eukprot:752031-Prymnesium_polylepis.1
MGEELEGPHRRGAGHRRQPRLQHRRRQPRRDQRGVRARRGAHAERWCCGRFIARAREALAVCCMGGMTGICDLAVGGSGWLGSLGWESSRGGGETEKTFNWELSG